MAQDRKIEDLDDLDDTCSPLHSDKKQESALGLQRSKSASALEGFNLATVFLRLTVQSRAHISTTVQAPTFLPTNFSTNMFLQH